MLDVVTLRINEQLYREITMYEKSINPEYSIDNILLYVIDMAYLLQWL